MKRARPSQINMSGAERGRGDPFHPTGHLGGGSSREGQQQDAVRINAIDNQVGGPVGQGLGLAGAGARDRQKGLAPVAESSRTPCFRRLWRLRDLNFRCAHRARRRDAAPG